MADNRLQASDDFLRRLAGALRSSQLYSTGHPIIGRSLASLAASIELLHATEGTITVGLVGSEIVVGDVPVAKAEAFGEIVRRLQAAGIERLTIERGVAGEEIALLIQTLAAAEARKT